MLALIIASFLSCTSVHASDLLKKVGQCSPQKGAKTVYLVKQWHLAPDVDTTNLETGKKQAQYQNQFEIFSAISQMIAEKKVDTTVAEGCEGTMDSKTKESFNGWTFEKLAKEVNDPKYPTILTHVLLKVEAKYKDLVKTICGDDLSQIKYAQLALSDLRGDVGYWTRIVENEKKPEKQKIYTDGVIEMLKLPSATNASNVLLALKKDVLDSFQKFSKANEERDDALIRAIRRADSTLPIVAVYGGLHSEDLKAKFQNEKWNCEIYEPKSYQNSEEKLLDDFRKLTR